jgi:two-component system, NarL family, invasion response regulator UvrY
MRNSPSKPASQTAKAPREAEPHGACAKAVRILIADDHAILREGLKQVLGAEFPGAIFGEAGSAAETVELLHREPWDLLVLDITMPGRSGLDVIEDARRARPELPVLVLSAHSEEHYAVRALTAGAKGYMTKNYPPGELTDAVHRLLAGRKYVTPSVGEALASRLEGPDAAKPHETLSNREFELLRLVAMGRTLKEAALELSLSESTIGTYHARLLAKMGLRSDVELTRYALREGLVE